MTRGERERADGRDLGCQMRRIFLPLFHHHHFLLPFSVPRIAGLNLCRLCDWDFPLYPSFGHWTWINSCHHVLYPSHHLHSPPERNLHENGDLPESVNSSFQERFSPCFRKEEECNYFLWWSCLWDLNISKGWTINMAIPMHSWVEEIRENSRKSSDSDLGCHDLNMILDLEVIGAESNMIIMDSCSFIWFHETARDPDQSQTWSRPIQTLYPHENRSKLTNCIVFVYLV